MSEDDYLKLLKAHDWTYQYSDDHGVWRKGSQAAQNLVNLANNDAKLKSLYTDYIEKNINTK